MTKPRKTRAQSDADWAARAIAGKARMSPNPNNFAWNPRGEPTWPEWREAVPGVTRVENVQTGWTGTFARWPKVSPGRKSPGYARVRWDRNGVEGRVVAYAFDLRVTTDNPDREERP